MIEHYAGAFPLWLSPVQAVVIPISQDQAAYADKVAATLKSSGVRVENWKDAESMQNKIRKAEGKKIPYMLVVGKREEAGEQVAVRARGNQNRGVWTVDAFLAEVNKKIDSKALAI